MNSSNRMKIWLEHWRYLTEWPCTWTKFWCRFRGHPAGVVWFTQGYEPDMHCKNCGDDIG